MAEKPTYRELEKRVKELEQEAVERLRMQDTQTLEAEKTDPPNVELKNPHLVDGKYSIRDLLDIESLRKTLEKFSLATGFATGFLEYPSQEILIATGWKDICTEFHRAIQGSARHCKESNIYLTNQMKDLKELNIRPCENGLVDGATPIVIKGKYIAYLATGQVLFEKPDIERFKKQAEMYGYNSEAYLKALSEVPVVSEDQFKNALSFLSELAVTIAKTGLSNLKLKERTKELEDEISERKNAERACQESEMKYSTLVENSKDGIIMICDGMLTFVNKASIHIVGYSPEEMINTNFLNFVAPDYREFITERYAELMESNDIPVTYEIKLLRKNGETIEVELDAIRIDFEGKPVALAFIRDISDRKQAEELLRESEKRYRRFFEDDLAGAFITDPDGQIIDCNPAFAHMFGFETTSDVKNVDLVSMYPSPSSRDEFLNKLKKEKRLERYETVMRHTGGSLIHTLENTAGVFDAQGNLVEIRGYLMDITEQKLLEKQLQQSQKMETIGTLAGGIAHDFNNILSAIMGYSELVLVDLPYEASIRNKIEAIHSSGERARDLVAQILAFSRKDEMVRSPVQVHLIIKDALKILRPAIPTTIDIHTQITSKCHILGDPSRVHQVIMNLCTNAYQAMLRTGGTLTISLSNVKMEGEAATLAQVPAGSYGKLVISDTGVGIPSENIARIFDPYFTTKEKGKGTGLGLAAVHGIIKSHGGAILVESQIGKGTKFEVYLPLTLDKSDAEGQAESQLIGGKERILLIDDEYDILEIEKEMLEKLGYTVTTRDKVREARKLFAKQPEQFDLVITDMTMPDMTGDKLAGELRKIRFDIPIIICTGFSELISRDKIESKGIKAFLTKPVSMKDLSTITRKVLDEKS